VIQDEFLGINDWLLGDFKVHMTKDNILKHLHLSVILDLDEKSYEKITLNFH